MADDSIPVSPARSKSEAKALGLSRYFTGKPCVRDHFVERRTIGGACIACLKLRAEATLEKRREYMRRYKKARPRRQAEGLIGPATPRYAPDDQGTQRQIISRRQAQKAGLRRYFTGEPCVNGHIAERYSTGPCVVCAKANDWIWKSRPENIVKRKFRDRERAKKRRLDPATGPVVKAQKKASAKRHAKKWRESMLYRLAGIPRPNQCEICRAVGKVCFDHCHASGRFRGWICNTCNSLLGIAKDNPDLLRALAAYLEKDITGRAPLPTYLRQELKQA